jgi:hypothetical protein
LFFLFGLTLTTSPAINPHCSLPVLTHIKVTMIFNAGFIYLLAVAGVNALPDSNREARQAGQLTIAWYSDPQCNGTPLSTDTVVEVDGICFGVNEPAGASHLRVVSNTARVTGKTLFLAQLKYGTRLTACPYIARLYNTSGCQAQGASSFDIIPGTEQGCSSFSGAKSLLWGPF